MIHIENISKQEQETASSRRGFLKGMLGAGAFVLSDQQLELSCPSLSAPSKEEANGGDTQTRRNGFRRKHTSSTSLRGEHILTTTIRLEEDGR